jgi:O-6-methylguanine DNA methyltransferase
MTEDLLHEKTIPCGSLSLTVRIETRSNLLMEVMLPSLVPSTLTVDCLKEAHRRLIEYEIRRPADSSAINFAEALLRIPYGTTETYGHLAKHLGSSPRGIASRCSANRLLIRIPCHRIVSSQGLGGYRAGVGWKKALIQLEATSGSAQYFPTS